MSRYCRHYGTLRLVKPFANWHDQVMTTVTVQKAQQDLPALIKRALAGEEIVIEVDDQRVRLAQEPPTPTFDEAAARRRGYGSMKGQFEVADGFFEPLPDDEQKLWEGQGGA